MAALAHWHPEIRQSAFHPVFQRPAPLIDATRLKDDRGKLSGSFRPQLSPFSGDLQLPETCRSLISRFLANVGPVAERQVPGREKREAAVRSPLNNGGTRSHLRPFAAWALMPNCTH